LFQRLVMHRVRRFLSTFALDVLRAVAASAIGAFIVTHQWTQTQTQAPAATPSSPATEQPVTQMVRDEHAAMGDYLKDEEAKERLALEKSRQDAKLARAEPRSDIDSHKVSSRPAATHASIEAQKPVAQANPPPASAPAVNGTPVDGPQTTVRIEAAGRANATTAVAAPTTPVPVATPNSDAIVATTLPPPAAAPDGSADAVKPAAPPQQSLADKAVAITHINDVIAFAHRFVGLFHFEEAPVPPADVRTNRFDG
jgi:hypothetical protein